MACLGFLPSLMCASTIWWKALGLWELGAAGVIPLAILGAKISSLSLSVSWTSQIHCQVQVLSDALAIESKKRLFSALSRAKDLLGSAKRSRLDENRGRQSLSTQFNHSLVPLSSSGQVNETLNAESSGACPTLSLSSHPTQEVSCADALSHNPPPSISQAILSTASTELDEEGLSLAQWRSRHVGVHMPLCYRQYDDVLPQPPPGVPPSCTAQQSEFNSSACSTDSARASLKAPPFRTKMSSHSKRFSSIPAMTPAESDVPAEPLDISFHPYPNRSSFELGHWYWNSTPWDKINSQLGASTQDEEGDEWEDEDAGARPYAAAELYHRPLISIIREKLSITQDNELFHYEPYKLRWSAPHLQQEVNIQGELYTSPAFMDVHRQLQESPGEPGCELPRVVVALMFWSVATHLMAFGNTKLWPLYMYFGNEMNILPKGTMITILTCIEDDVWWQLPDSFKDFACTYTGGKVGRECLTHCHRELFQAQWRVLFDAEFLQAYEHGIVIACCDGVKRRFYPQIFTYSADYPEKVLIATIRQLGGCPCPRCLIPMGRLHNLGLPHDMQQRATLARSDSSRSHLVSTACNLIYEKNHGVDGTAVEALLKPNSWVPTSNTFSDCLGLFGFNEFVALVVDLLHEFELGVWHMLLLHLLRIICALNKDLIHELDRRSADYLSDDYSTG
ncbi:hypothetical protein EV702DRAFT_1203618 [Suillus placidus]|uniref:Uncharacterized protein n=1 Tax=Suillus placidus TaxID=48579 RepID=A0A9P7CXV3_9AGAM|nr:hypothetical protein EV702DRAFT_1203618 [Suillus placidus]